MERLIVNFEKIYARGFLFIGIPIVIITVIESLNAVGRKLLIPFPCAVESVESLMVVCTYLGVSAVAAEGGHVNVILMTRKLPQSVQTFIDGGVNFFATCIFGIWAYAAWVEAFKSLRIWEMRIGVFNFPLYPFKIVFAIGLTMLALQLFLNGIKFITAALGHPIVKITAEEKPLLEM